MLCSYPANDEKARLAFCLSLNFQKIRILPQLLGRPEINSVLRQIGLALIVVELESFLEYKLSLFYS